MNDKDPQLDDRTARLVEYLDGESDPATVAEVEGSLSRDPKVRREIESLQRAWDMLDFLPMPAAKNDFSQRTVEMAAQSLASTDFRIIEPKRWPFALLWISGLAAAFAAGAAVVLARPGGDKELTDNRLLLENLEDYRAVGDVRFLDLLQSEKLAEHMDTFLEPGS